MNIQEFESTIKVQKKYDFKYQIKHEEQKLMYENIRIRQTTKTPEQPIYLTLKNTILYNLYLKGMKHIRRIFSQS